MSQIKPENRTSIDVVNEFINKLLTRCIEKKMVIQYDDQTFMSEEDGRKYDELLLKEKLIEQNLNRCKRDKAKVKIMLSEFRRGKNLKTKLPIMLQKTIIDKISPPALVSLLNKSFDTESNVISLIEKVNELTRHVQYNANISNVEDNVFTNEEEELYETYTTMNTTKNKTTRKRKHGETDTSDLQQSISSDQKRQLTMDLYLSENDTE